MGTVPQVLAEALTAGTLLAGHSVADREIWAVRTGDADAPRTVLVVGAIHGTERAGKAVVRALRRTDAPDGVQVWTVRSANPDGERARTRQNARGVDLNRNWPHRWRASGRPWDTYYPGPRRASEPETRAMKALIERLQPDVTVWFHQALSLVNLVPRADKGIIRRYGRAVGLPAKWLPRYRGTATSWQNARLPDSTAFVVELGSGPLDAAGVRRHVRAVHGTVSPQAAAAQERPEIEWTPIPFGKKRKRQMAAYSERHYGEREWRLNEVKTIVQHYTASTTFESAFNTFAANARDVELGELPGVCTQFVIDTDGTIHKLVRLTIRCRHTVGLNDRSIGIEHVGTSDAAVMGNKRQLRASLRLTRWLMAKYDVPRKHVIGHAESLSSPFHHERVERLKTQTHGDMQPSTMRRYRRKL
jgi:beta-N-acetylhexosaminidase